LQYQKERLIFKRAMFSHIRIVSGTLKWICAACAVAPALSGCRVQPAEAKSADTLSVAFYNVENLFDNEFDGDEYPEYRPNATNWDSRMHRIKMDNISSVIAAINATVVTLCEVEDRDALGQLRSALDQKGVDYPHSAIIDTPAVRATCTALLSRIPVNRLLAHEVSLPNGRPGRLIFEVGLLVTPSVPLTLFINHWPSKKQPESFRLAAADVLAKAIAALPAATDYIIVGDLNSDYDEFATFTTFGHNDTRGITGINHRLGTIVQGSALSMRPKSREEVCAAHFPSHYDLWCDIAEELRMSYFFQGNRQTPDHILLPPSLFDSVGISYLDKSFDVFVWGGRLLSHGKPLRWKTRGAEWKYHLGEGYSDHLPIVAKFVRSPFSADLHEPTKENPVENGGWVAANDNVRSGRDTTAPKPGRYSLRIVSPALKKNGTAASCVVTPELRASKSGSSLQLYVRGSSKITFRTRIAGGSSWRYHDLVADKWSSRATYRQVNFASWRPVTLAVGVPPGTSFELELRSAANAPLDLSIDR